MAFTEEDRYLLPKEITNGTIYTYKTGTEPSGMQAIYLTMQGTTNTLAFLQF
jgi:hypothetical protein